MRARLVIVGTGAVGCGIACAWRDAGGTVAAVLSRDAERARRVSERWGATEGRTDLPAPHRFDIVIVAVPDRAISQVGAVLLGSGRSGDAILLHTSGAHDGRELTRELPEPVLFAARVGSLHPLQSFASPAAEHPETQLAARARGVHWFHEGAGADAARQVVAALSGHFHELAPGGKTLYHAGAAVLSNHLVALFDMSLRLLDGAGLSRQEAHAPLMALLGGTCANLETSGVPSALTGPVARGDVGTVTNHLEAIEQTAAELLPAYREMALRAVEVALAKGSIDAVRAQELRATLRR